MEFEGRNLEEAILAAASALNLPPEKLKFTIISMGTKGFLGIGRRKAKIGINSEDQMNDLEGEALGVSDAASDEVWSGPQAKKPEGTVHSLDFMHEDRGQFPGRADRSAKGGLKKVKTDKVREPGRAREYGRPDIPAEELPPLDFSHLPPPPTQVGPGESRHEGDPDRAMALAQKILSEILFRMGFSTEVSVDRIANRIILTLADSADNALLIGSRGSTLEALQLLTGRILIKRLKAEGLEEAADLKVVVDVADYRARRQTTILESLRTIANHVRRTRKSQSMNGLNGSERRLVQLALRSTRDLSSRNDADRDSVIISIYRPKHEKGGSGPV